jgi:hypothetical protein
MIHEETIPKDLRKLKINIEKDGVLKAPIIVDKNTNIVLDGMHRTAALNSIGCNYSCVCYVDYKNPNILVERWIRTINKLDLDTAKNILEKLDLETERFNHPGEIHKDHNEIILVLNNDVFKIKINSDSKVSVLKKLYDFELELEKTNFHINYKTEQEALTLIRKSSVEALIFPPIISKKEVIHYTGKKKIFVPKATRHIIPARPLDVNCSLKLLQNTDLPLEEVNNRLKNELESKKLSQLPKGSILAGRRYDEALYVFKD